MPQCKVVWNIVESVNCAMLQIPQKKSIWAKTSLKGAKACTYRTNLNINC